MTICLFFMTIHFRYNPGCLVFRNNTVCLQIYVSTSPIYGDYFEVADESSKPGTFWIVDEFNPSSQLKVGYWSTFIGNFTTTMPPKSRSRYVDCCNTYPCGVAVKILFMKSMISPNVNGLFE
jgi:hypothetical protein